MDVKKTIKSAVAVVLFSLLIISFAMFGIHDAFKPIAKDSVLRAGSHEVSGADFKREFNRRKDEAQQKSGRPINVEEAVASGADVQVLQSLATQAAIDEIVSRLGVRASPKMIANGLGEIPDFFDQVTGRFDAKAYQSVLEQNGLTAKTFEKGMAEEMARNQFLSAIGAGLKSPLSFGALRGVYGLEKRDASFVFVDPSKVAAPPAPTDAQLQAFLTENAAQFRTPELRQLTIARFSAKALLPTMKADPAEVQKVFDFRKDQASTPETRTVVQIPAKDQAAAQAIAARLTKGEDPGTVAKSVGAALITYSSKPKTALPDRKVADVAFTLPAGQVSGPIQGELGFAVVKVMNITPGTTIALDKVRDQVEQEVKKRAAELKLSEQSDKYETAHEAGADIVAAAKAAGGVIHTTPAISARGMDKVGQPATATFPILSQQLMELAFGMAQGEESEFETDAPGEYYVVRVDKVVPAATPPLADVRARLEKYFVARELDKRLKAKGDELAARLRKGEPIEAVAASVGTTPSRVSDLNRMQAEEQAKAVGQSLVQAVMTGKKGEVQITPAPKPGLIVVKIDAIRPGDADQIARFASQARDQMGQELSQELGDALFRGSIRSVKTKTYPERARAALGLAPVVPTDAKGADAEKPKEKAG